MTRDEIERKVRALLKTEIVQLPEVCVKEIDGMMHLSVTRHAKFKIVIAPECEWQNSFSHYWRGKNLSGSGQEV